jgi:hypothetical protein
MDGCHLHLDNTASTDAILNVGNIRMWLSEIMVCLVCNKHFNLTAPWECESCSSCPVLGHESIQNILPYVNIH